MLAAASAVQFRAKRYLLVAVDHAPHGPSLRPALVAQEIENAVGGDRGIDDESAEIAHHPGLAEIAEEEIGDESLLDGGKQYGLEAQPRSKRAAIISAPSAKIMIPQCRRAGTLEGV